jgi:hypothetical protein
LPGILYLADENFNGRSLGLQNLAISENNQSGKKVADICEEKGKYYRILNPADCLNNGCRYKKISRVGKCLYEWTN